MELFTFGYLRRQKKNCSIHATVPYLEAPTGIEPVIEVLQTFALPLGHGALTPRVGLEPTTTRLTAERSTN